MSATTTTTSTSTLSLSNTMSESPLRTDTGLLERLTSRNPLMPLPKPKSRDAKIAHGLGPEVKKVYFSSFIIVNCYKINDQTMTCDLFWFCCTLLIMRLKHTIKFLPICTPISSYWMNFWCFQKHAALKKSRKYAHSELSWHHRWHYPSRSKTRRTKNDTYMHNCFCPKQFWNIT